MFADLYRVFTDPRRRRLLRRLNETPLDGVNASAIGHSADGSHSDDLAVEMRHVHLPMLEDAGFIDWDRESQRVSRGPRFNELDDVLQVADEHDPVRPVDWPY